MNFVFSYFPMLYWCQYEGRPRMNFIGKLRTLFVSLTSRNEKKSIIEITVTYYNASEQFFSSPTEIHHFAVIKGDIITIPANWNMSIEVEILKIMPEGIKIKTNETLVNHKNMNSHAATHQQEFTIPIQHSLELVTPTYDKCAYFNFEIIDENK